MNILGMILIIVAAFLAGIAGDIPAFPVEILGTTIGEILGSQSTAALYTMAAVTAFAAIFLIWLNERSLAYKGKQTVFPKSFLFLRED